MKQYIKLLKKILKKGVEKESGRANMPNTWGIDYGKITMDLRDGFPLLTTKKMFWKGIVHELLWFLRGETNIKPLVDNGVNIWNGDGYRWYCKYAEANTDNPNPIMRDNGDGTLSMYTYDEFVEKVKTLDKLPQTKDGKYTLGDLGKVYGYQWRNQNGVDQVKDVVEGLKANPYSRYHIIDGWNKADFRDMALPPCHLLYQFIVKPMSAEARWDLMHNDNVKWNEPLGMKNDSDEEIHRICDEHNIPKFYLNLNMYQRSCDTFLGVPFNIASMSLLLMIIAKSANMIPRKSRWIGGDVHLYMDHIPVVTEQIAREPKYLPQMVINKDINTLDDITSLKIEDFELQNYESYDKLKGELFSGNKKEKK